MLALCLLLGADDLYTLPRTLGAIGRWFIAVLNAVVLISLAHGAQRFVVQAGQAESFFQLFGELL